MKIAHLTDLHLSKIGALEKNLLATLQKEAPDLIVITGDIYSGPESKEPGLDFLASLKAPKGVFLVDGNWDHWTLPKSGLRDLAQESKVVLLRNESRQIGDNLWVVGMDDLLAGTPTPSEAFSNLPPQASCIALFHSPEYFSEIAGRCALNLSGHTHGGQVRFPGLNPLWLPPGSGPYVSGWYTSSNSKLYVNRGTGTSILPIRFFARPEMAFFTIGEEK